MSKDYNALADKWVGEFVDENVRKRIFDGRPDRIFVKTLTIAIGELLQAECAAAVEDAKPRKGAK